MKKVLRYGMVGGGPGSFIGDAHRRAIALDSTAELVAGVFSSHPEKSRETAEALGLDPARCAAALSRYQATGMRQHIVEKGGITFIEDCYNASPDSMKAALSVLKALPNVRKIALLGDMLELGDASESGHRATGEWAADAGVSLLIAYGPNSAAMAEAAKNRGIATVHCQTAAEVLQYLQQSVRPGDAVLAKASHAMKLDEILADFYAALPQA